MIALALALALQSGAESADPIGALIAAQDADAAGVHEIAQGCSGQRREGALLICRYWPGSDVRLGEMSATADADGFVVLGIPRDAPETLAFSVTAPGDAGRVFEDWSIEQREYVLQHVNGVPQATVTPDESTLPRRQREYAQKREALATRWDGQGFLDGFIRPSEGITTGVYGSARVYNDGHQGNPHWGLDWANETGTPVIAPASGRIILAEDDMYYEGGLVFLDHGQGLVSLFLHMSAVHVSEGDMVEQGDLIGEIGAGGRATGPHLDWRVKINDSFYVDPAMMLDLDLAPIRD